MTPPDATTNRCIASTSQLLLVVAKSVDGDSLDLFVRTHNKSAAIQMMLEYYGFGAEDLMEPARAFVVPSHLGPTGPVEWVEA
jgi:hypothetical protein